LFTINTNFFENLEERFIDGKIKEELYEKFASKFNMEKEELWLQLQPTPINTKPF
jgi:hypothetical protein